MAAEAAEVQKMLAKLEEAVNALPRHNPNEGDSNKQENMEHLSINNGNQGEDNEENLGELHESENVHDSTDFDLLKSSKKSVRYTVEQNAEILRQVKILNPFATKYGDKHQSWGKVAENVQQILNIPISGKQCREQTHRICNRFRESQKGQDLLNNEYEYVDPIDQLYLDVIELIGKDRRSTPTKKVKKIIKDEGLQHINYSGEDSLGSNLKRLLPKSDNHDINLHNRNQAQEYLNLLTNNNKVPIKRAKPALEGVDQQLILISQTEQMRLQELKQQTELMKDMLTFKGSIDQRLSILESKVDSFHAMLSNFINSQASKK